MKEISQKHNFLLCLFSFDRQHYHLPATVLSSYTRVISINSFWQKSQGLFYSKAMNITTIKIKMTLTDIIRIRISIHFDLALKVALPWKHLQGSPPPPSPPTSPPPSTSPSQCSNIHHHHSPWLGTKLLLHKGVCKGLQNLGSWSPKLVYPP